MFTNKPILSDTDCVLRSYGMPLTQVSKTIPNGYESDGLIVNTNPGQKDFPAVLKGSLYLDDDCIVRYAQEDMYLAEGYAVLRIKVKQLELKVAETIQVSVKDIYGMELPALLNDVGLPLSRVSRFGIVKKGETYVAQRTHLVSRHEGHKFHVADKFIRVVLK